MPIRPENRHRYPNNWREISHRIRFDRARGRCECRGECGRPRRHLDHDARCRNRHNQPAWLTGTRVILTTAHLNHTPEDCDDENLRAWCQACHLHYDATHHAATRQRTHAHQLAQELIPLFDLPTNPDSTD
ncbi:hypothetical protein [Tamaricihabitans halophyticus]|uniref:hypothetical protein n=1 Tax=Tamaricihabitans halophyticus TaxID=1262583 RepID=UPI001FB2E244|nr:hypothetical protein [Tamaricihabitans halophyticus]